MLLSYVLWVIAFSSPDSLVISPKVYERNLIITFQNFGTVTNPATVTKSIGLLANALLSWFLHRRLDSFIVTGQIRFHYRDSAIWTTSSRHENPRPSTGTLQKHMPTLTQTATSHTTGPLYVRF
jgi:hypothetical protein